MEGEVGDIHGQAPCHHMLAWCHHHHHHHHPTPQNSHATRQEASAGRVGCVSRAWGARVVGMGVLGAHPPRLHAASTGHLSPSASAGHRIRANGSFLAQHRCARRPGHHWLLVNGPIGLGVPCGGWWRVRLVTYMGRPLAATFWPGAQPPGHPQLYRGYARHPTIALPTADKTEPPPSP